MGYLKNSAAFQVAMDEQRQQDECSYERFQEEEYLGVPVAKADRRSTAPAAFGEPLPPPSRAEVLTGKVCAYCNGATTYVDSAEVYRRSYGMIYLCRPCRAWVGVHKGSNVALGRVANAELRDLKKAVHAVFDPVWKQGHLPRGKAYEWLALRMDLPVEQCHVGMFNEKQCRLAIGLLEEWEGVTTEL
jgi:hypothetical protein